MEELLKMVETIPQEYVTLGMAGAVIVLAVLVLILFIICIVMNSKLKKQKLHYEHFMGTEADPSETLMEKLDHYFETSKHIESEYDKLLDYANDLDETMKKNIQKVGLVRYNPFEEMGGNLCFALALLDAGDNGVVVNGIHTRTGSYTYAKPIEKGESTYALSGEEMQAIDMAKKGAYEPKHEKLGRTKGKTSSLQESREQRAAAIRAVMEEETENAEEKK